MHRLRLFLPLALCLLLTAGFAAADSHEMAGDHPATPEGAAAFVEDANAELSGLSHTAAHAAWLQQTYITYSSEALAAQLSEKLLGRAVALAQEASKFDGVEGIDPHVQRQLDILKQAISMPAPNDPELTAELSQIAATMTSNYGAASWCPSEGEQGAEPGDEGCRNIVDYTKTHAESRDAAELEEAWVQWRTTSPAIRDEYQRFVEIANAGAQELGYPDLGAMWRSNYDMEPDEFAAEMDRLWGQVEPLYESLHCFVRGKLAEHYGEDVVPLDSPIPAHLLGNIWAQGWGNIYDLVAPGAADPGYDLESLLKENEYDAEKMVKQGEAFFTSLGFAPLPDTFWERSMFTKPRDREVVCHASAWDVD